MEIVTIAGVAVVAAFLAVVLRQQRPEQAMAVSLAAGLGILMLVVTKAMPVVGALRNLLEGAALPKEYAAVVFKALGICLLTQLSADACRDAGETALASKAELAGKLFLLTLALPLFEKIAQTAALLINGGS